MRSPCVSHPITEPQIDDNYEFLCRLWSPVVGAEEGGAVARGFQRVKHDEARINPNDISVDDIPIDSDTSLSLSVGLNEMPITTDTQPKDKENCGQIDAPNQNITDENPQNANILLIQLMVKISARIPMMGVPNRITLILLLLILLLKLIPLKIHVIIIQTLIWIKLQYVSSIYKESVHTV